MTDRRITDFALPFRYGLYSSRSIQSSLIWRWVALPVKMCTTAALVSSLMKLIYQMSFQVVECLIKGISKFFILDLRYQRFVIHCNYSILSLGTVSFWNLCVCESLNYLLCFSTPPSKNIDILFWGCKFKFVCLFSLCFITLVWL